MTMTPDRRTTDAPVTNRQVATSHPMPGERTHEHLRNYPPVENWDSHIEYDAKAHPRKVPHEYMLVPTTCFNCESACGLLAYVDKSDLSIKKVEGNPAHPGSRGRNCAKGPATINQINDPERILYPLRRTGERGGGQWERVSWDDALDDIAGRIRKAIQEGRNNEVAYHVGRPGEDGFAERVLQAWDVDGHNSHTQVCSSGARLGQALWGGYDRPSPDHAHAKVILLFSSHLETGHYFNPHAQRIMEGKQGGAKLIVVDPRLSNTAAHADVWVSPWPGSEAAILLAIASHLLTTRQIDEPFLRRWFNWDVYLENRHPGAPRDLRGVPGPVGGRLPRVHVRVRGAGGAGPGRADPADGRTGRRLRRPPGRAHLAQRRRRQLRRLAGRPLAVVRHRPDRLDRHRGRNRAQRLEQVHPARPGRAGARALEPHDLAGGVPAELQRDVDPAAALHARRPREDGRLLLPRVQPDLDLSRRVHLDAGPDRPGEDGLSHRPDPDLVGDGGVRRLRPSGRALHRAPRHPVL